MTKERIERIEKAIDLINMGFREMECIGGFSDILRELDDLIYKIQIVQRGAQE